MIHDLNLVFYHYAFNFLRNQLCHQYFTHFHMLLFFQFLNVLRRELGEVEKNKEAFLADFTQVMHRGAYCFVASLTCAYASFGRLHLWFFQFHLLAGGLWRHCERLEREAETELCRWAEVGAVHCDQVIWPGIIGLFGIRMAVAVALLLDRWFSLEVEDLRQNKNVCCCVYATSISVVYVLCKLHTQSCRMWLLCGCLSVDVTLSLEVPVHFRCALVRAIRKYILCIIYCRFRAILLDGGS